MSETQTSSETEGSPEDRTAAPSDEATVSAADRLEQEGEIAADYLEELLEIVDLDGDIDMDVEGDRATVSIVGADLPQLVATTARCSRRCRSSPGSRSTARPASGPG